MHELDLLLHLSPFVGQLVKASLLDGNWIRFALLLSTPFTFLLAMARSLLLLFSLFPANLYFPLWPQFFCICVAGNIWQAFGPIAHFHQNSSYYSGIAPPRSLKSKMPHFTVQMPVYEVCADMFLQLRARLGAQRTKAELFLHVGLIRLHFKRRASKLLSYPPSNLSRRLSLRESSSSAFRSLLNTTDASLPSSSPAMNGKEERCRSWSARTECRFVSVTDWF